MASLLYSALFNMVASFSATSFLQIIFVSSKCSLHFAAILNAARWPDSALVLQPRSAWTRAISWSALALNTSSSKGVLSATMQIAESVPVRLTSLDLPLISFSLMF